MEETDEYDATLGSAIDIDKVGSLPYADGFVPSSKLDKAERRDLPLHLRYPKWASKAVQCLVSESSALLQLADTEYSTEDRLVAIDLATQAWLDFATDYHGAVIGELHSQLDAAEANNAVYTVQSLLMASAARKLYEKLKADHWEKATWSTFDKNKRAVKNFKSVLRRMQTQSAPMVLPFLDSLLAALEGNHVTMDRTMFLSAVHRMHERHLQIKDRARTHGMKKKARDSLLANNREADERELRMMFKQYMAVTNLFVNTETLPSFARQRPWNLGRISLDAYAELTNNDAQKE